MIILKNKELHQHPNVKTLKYLFENFIIIVKGNETNEMGNVQSTKYVF